jgi:hypothetical protein
LGKSHRFGRQPPLWEIAAAFGDKCRFCNEKSTLFLGERVAFQKTSGSLFERAFALSREVVALWFALWHREIRLWKDFERVALRKCHHFLKEAAFGTFWKRESLLERKEQSLFGGERAF